MSTFRVGLSAAFYLPDGSPAYPSFDVSPMTNARGLEMIRLRATSELQPADVADLDAVILMGEAYGRPARHENGRLALVARFGVGFDRVDTVACSDADVALVTTPDGVRRPVAVSVLAFLLALTGRMFDKDRITRKGAAGFAEKSAYIGMGLIGRTFGVLGLGSIGAETVRVMQPLGMNFIAFDPYADKAVAAALGIRMVDKDTLFRESDFLSINCPLTAETQHIVDARALSLMKPTAYLINTARGPVVDQKALTEALTARRIAGAGLDVFDPEPPEPDDPILKLDNVILAPHALAHTDQCFGGIGAADVAAVLSVMKGEVPRGNIVNRDVVDRPGWRSKLAAYGRRFGG
jgi:phosphoglycerate dehydrogenase-like enzyme